MRPSAPKPHLDLIVRYQNIDLFSLTRLPTPGLQTPAERTSLSPVVFHIPSLSACILVILNPSLLLFWRLALKVARSTASQHIQSKSQSLYNGPKALHALIPLPHHFSSLHHFFLASLSVSFFFHEHSKDTPAWTVSSR